MPDTATKPLTLIQQASAAWRTSHLRRGQSTAAYEAGDRATGADRAAHYRRALELLDEADRLAAEARTLANKLPPWSALRREVLDA